MSTYRLFGFRLASELSFAGRLERTAGPPDLELACRPAAPRPSWRGLSPAYVSPHRTAQGEPAARLFRLEGREVLQFPGTADFLIEAGRITGHAPAGARPGLDACFLGPVASYWLERRGLPVLHGSAVEAGSAAVAFLADSGGGKSSLAAALVQLGLPLLTDDLLAVERRAGRFFARPGLPQVRMWPDAAAHFLGPWEHLPRVQRGLDKRQVPVGPGGFGRFSGADLPLRCLYVLERHGGEVEIAPLPRGRALIELVRNSFAAHLVESVGLQPRRLELFSELVREVPVRRLLVPEGLSHLPRVAEALLRDLEAL